MKYFFQKYTFETIIVFANIILAAIVIANPSNTINTDGILYLQTAQVYWTNGWQAAIQHYPWPFYPMLIAWIAHLFHSSLEITAHGLNIIFQTLICLGFFYIACEIRGIPYGRHSVACPGDDDSARLQAVNNFYLCATLITILFFPVFNHIRDLIIRDFAYWAASLWAWLALLQFSRTKKLYRGFQFGILMLIAGLFRLEGFVMLLLGPFALWGLKKTTLHEKLKLFLIANSVTLASGACLIFYLVFFSHDMHKIGRLLDFKTQFLSGMGSIIHTFSQAKHQLVHSVLTTLSVDSATTLLVGALCVLYLKMLITTLSPLYALLFGLSLGKKQFSPISEAKPVLLTAVVLNLLITVIFLLQNLFLTTRYLMGLTFFLLLWVPFGVLALYKKTEVMPTVTSTSPTSRGSSAGSRSSGWFYWIPRIKYLPLQRQGRGTSAIGEHLLLHDKIKFNLSLFLIITIGTISLWDFGVSRLYLKDAGRWIHDTLPDNAKIYTNNVQVQFYAKKPLMIYDNTIALKQIKTSGYQYFAFLITSSNQSVVASLNQYFIEPIKVFRNSKNDGVWIYHVN